ncbi:MAG: helix-turn-helix transcriptional regulator [Bdellovibrionales bacterium]|nr:helix-turn-helix transcriptional regulator [Bdellovibrionales bacterium]
MHQIKVEAMSNRMISKKDEKLLKKVGAKIQKLRNQKNLTVYELTGSDLPIKSRQHWQKIENGQKNINLTTLFKVAETLGVKAEELVKGIK